jgi:REP element-mobilizing transposase RayT
MNSDKRKKLRLDKYDYSQNGAYFSTIFTYNILHLFGDLQNGHLFLSDAGKMVERYLKEIIIYENVALDKYVIMPNHVHAIIVISHGRTTQGSFPTLSEYIRRFKMITTKTYIDGVKAGKYPSFEKTIWQKSFYDHIIRNENEYLQVWKYIDENPLKWETDEYYK